MQFDPDLLTYKKMEQTVLTWEHVQRLQCMLDEAAAPFIGKPMDSARPLLDALQQRINVWALQRVRDVEPKLSGQQLLQMPMAELLDTVKACAAAALIHEVPVQGQLSFASFIDVDRCGLDLGHNVLTPERAYELGIDADNPPLGIKIEPSHLPQPGSVWRRRSNVHDICIVQLSRQVDGGIHVHWTTGVITHTTLAVWHKEWRYSGKDVSDVSPGVTVHG